LHILARLDAGGAAVVSAAPPAKVERGYDRPVRAARWQEPSGPCVFGYQH